MTEQEISQLVELYGLERILEDNYMTLPFALSILDELGYIELEQYLEQDDDYV